MANNADPAPVGKPWYKSKIIWMNLASVAVAILTYLATQSFEDAALFGVVANVITIVLRYQWTDTPIS